MCEHIGEVFSTLASGPSLCGMYEPFRRVLNERIASQPFRPLPHLPERDFRTPTRALRSGNGLCCARIYDVSVQPRSVFRQESSDVSACLLPFRPNPRGKCVDLLVGILRICQIYSTAVEIGENLLICGLSNLSILL